MGPNDFKTYLTGVALTCRPAQDPCGACVCIHQIGRERPSGLRKPCCQRKSPMGLHRALGFAICVWQPVFLLWPCCVHPRVGAVLAHPEARLDYGASPASLWRDVYMGRRPRASLAFALDSEHARRSSAISLYGAPCPGASRYPSVTRWRCRGRDGRGARCAVSLLGVFGPKHVRAAFAML